MHSVPSCFLLHPFSFFLLLLLPNWQTRKNREWAVIFRLGPYTQHRFQIWGCGGWAGAGVLLDNAFERAEAVFEYRGVSQPRCPPAACVTRNLET